MFTKWYILAKEQTPVTLNDSNLIIIYFIGAIVTVSTIWTESIAPDEVTF